MIFSRFFMSLILLCFSHFAVSSENEVLTDSMFTASILGPELAKACLNPGKGPGNFGFNSFPGTNPARFIKRIKNIQTLFRLSSEGKVSGYRKIKGKYYPKPVFDKILKDKKTKKVFVFLGRNSLGGAGVRDASKMVDKIIKSGKKCVYGLPFLYSWKGKKIGKEKRRELDRKIKRTNEKIKNFNKKLFTKIKSKCKILDPSKTLKNRQVFFDSDDIVHLTKEGSRATARAYCEELGISQSAGLEPVQSESEATTL